MGILFLVLILFIAGLVLFFLKVKDYNGNKIKLRPWSAIPFGLGVLIFLIGSINQVGAGQVAVPVTFGNTGSAVGPGLHLAMPWTKFHSISVRVQNYTMSGSTNEGAKQGNDSVPVNTKDQVTVNVDSTVLFRLTKGEAKSVYVNLGGDYVNTVVRPTIRSAIRDAAVRYNAIDLATDDRAAFQAQAQSQIEKTLSNKGIEVIDLQIRDMNLPASLQNAIVEKAAAQQNVVKQQFVLQATQQQAQQRIIQAKGIREAQDIIKQTLTPQYLEYEYIQTLQQLASSKNTTYLFLPNNPQDLPNFQIPLTGAK